MPAQLYVIAYLVHNQQPHGSPATSSLPMGVFLKAVPVLHHSAVNPTRFYPDSADTFSKAHNELAADTEDVPPPEMVIPGPSASGKPRKGTLTFAVWLPHFRTQENNDEQ
jgi:hypothetical protein